MDGKEKEEATKTESSSKLPASDGADDKSAEAEPKTGCTTQRTARGSASSSWLLPEASWAASWVKEKTKSTFETIRKDIHEFSDTLQNETNSLASAAVKKAQIISQIIVPTSDDAANKDGQKAAEEEEKATPIATMAANSPGTEHSEQSGGEQQKGSAAAGSNFFGLDWVKQMANEVVETVHKFATEDTTKDEAECTEEIRLGPGGRKTLLDQCTLLQMQNDRRTFLQKPQRGDELYNEWLDGFKISEYNGEINLLLGHNSRLRELYAELVPSEVDNHTFWNRYFFKVHMKELEKQQKQKEEENGLKIDTTSNKAAGAGEGHSPAPSNNGRDRDDWSMCSSGRTTEAEELDAGAKGSREEVSTPRPAPAVRKNEAGEDDMDDWEECDEGAAEVAKEK